ncbi:MAG: helix-turn-helix domain-containing protein [Acidobacteria bacterium]|nr:helix-turn-helix domain-containing protein [Acidobacteriota bacterium]
MEDLLTVEQLAELLSTTPSAIHSQRHRGQAPGRLGVKLGKRYFYRRQDLDAFFASELAKQPAGAA